MLVSFLPCKGIADPCCLQMSWSGCVEVPALDLIVLIEMQKQETGLFFLIVCFTELYVCEPCNILI